MRVTSKLSLVAASAVVAVVLSNYFLVHKPVTDRLVVDARNAGMSIWAHYKYGVDPNTIVIDLRKLGENKAPVDLWRAVFQSAGVIHKAKRTPDVVVLQRSGSDVFKLKGAEFLEVGSAFDAGENPLYLLRTMPEKLYRPDGTRAYSTWTGGWLGVMGKQMDDLADATKVWAIGTMAPQ